jgi:hypothetical protein
MHRRFELPPVLARIIIMIILGAALSLSLLPADTEE